MRGFLLRFLINILALWLTGLLAQQLGLKLEVHSFLAGFSAVVLLGFVNTFIAPILILVTRLLTLPLSCLTLGLFGFVIGFVINALLFLFVGNIVPGFVVGGFLPALFGSIVMGILAPVLQSLTGTRN